MVSLDRRYDSAPAWHCDAHGLVLAVGLADTLWSAAGVVQIEKRLPVCAAHVPV